MRAGAMASTGGLVRGAGALSCPGIGGSGGVEAYEAEYEGGAERTRRMTNGVRAPSLTVFLPSPASGCEEEVKKKWERRRSGRTPRFSFCVSTGPRARTTHDGSASGAGRRRTVSFGITCPPSQSTLYSIAEGRERSRTVQYSRLPLPRGAGRGSRGREGEECRARRAHATKDGGKEEDEDGTPGPRKYLSVQALLYTTVPGLLHNLVAELTVAIFRLAAVELKGKWRSS
ncbi:hypothetical protein FB451DRAFT_1176739 [Mycena latifolia]|nr:hypothetical protein FB451DRAFT_1176739 [Mycena latifolia]